MDLIPCVVVGLDHVALAHARLLRRAHHQRHIRPVDVRVDQPHPLSQLRQRNRQVHCDRGLAHAALAGTDSDDLRNAGQCYRRRHGRGMRHNFLLLLFLNLLLLNSLVLSKLHFRNLIRLRSLLWVHFLFQRRRDQPFFLPPLVLRLAMFPAPQSIRIPPDLVRRLRQKLRNLLQPSMLVNGHKHHVGAGHMHHCRPSACFPPTP